MNTAANDSSTNANNTNANNRADDHVVATDEFREPTAALEYMSGFGNEFATEAIAGTLPVGQNSPQRVAHGLYAEQLSGTAFTAPRALNRRSWLYRIRPAAIHGPFAPYRQPHLHSDFESGAVSPDQLRWDSLPMPGPGGKSRPVGFV